MNAAQQIIFERFAAATIQARVERLWQPSAYIGSYGDLASPQISKYIQNWAGALATNVKLHETSSWHLEFTDAPDSDQRETPRDKLVASRIHRCAGIATNVKLHETSSWHLEFTDAPDSDQRETPRDKLVASRIHRCAR